MTKPIAKQKTVGKDAPLMICSFCEYPFDRTDKRAYVPNHPKRPDECYCPYCCAMRLGGTEMWAVWNDCNGIFEVTDKRAQAFKLIEKTGHLNGCGVVPVRVFVDDEDEHFLRHHEEDEREAFWGKA